MPILCLCLNRDKLGHVLRRRQVTCLNDSRGHHGARDDAGWLQADGRGSGQTLVETQYRDQATPNRGEGNRSEQHAIKERTGGGSYRRGKVLLRGGRASRRRFIQSSDNQGGKPSRLWLVRCMGVRPVQHQQAIFLWRPFPSQLNTENFTEKCN